MHRGKGALACQFAGLQPQALAETRGTVYFFFASSAAKVPPSAASFSISGAIFQRAPYLAS